MYFRTPRRNFSVNCMGIALMITSASNSARKASASAVIRVLNLKFFQMQRVVPLVVDSFHHFITTGEDNDVMTVAGNGSCHCSSERTRVEYYNFHVSQRQRGKVSKVSKVSCAGLHVILMLTLTHEHVLNARPPVWVQTLEF